jgi:hypothetical protein
MNAKTRGQVKVRCQAANTYAFFIMIGMVLCAGGDYWLEIGILVDVLSVAVQWMVQWMM